MRNAEWATPEQLNLMTAWRARLQRIEEAAARGDWQVVGERCEGLLDTLRARMPRGMDEAAWYGPAVTYLALARAGLGDRQGAAWWWWTAGQIWPEAATLDLSPYGDVGLALRDLDGPCKPRLASPSSSAIASGEPAAARASEPAVRARVEPAFPAWSAGLGPGRELVLEILVAEDGSVAQPLIVQGLGPSMDVEALRAVRSWSFAPARDASTGAPRPAAVTIRLDPQRRPRKSRTGADD